MLESNVTYYSKKYPEVWIKAENAILTAKDGGKYIDFHSSAGSVNYGHNNTYIMEKVKKYIESQGIIQGLDMSTSAKNEFMSYFYEEILKKRKLNYKMQFTGPTGTNAVEAAIKLARKIKKRYNIFSFQNGFHGMTSSSLSVSSIGKTREGIRRDGVTFIPHWFLHEKGIDTVEYMKYLINDNHSGVEVPAAIIIETIQAEGGIRIFDDDFLRRCIEFCKENDILFICDDIQVGCYRTGTFFSFEKAGIYPDIITMSMVLIKPEYDCWYSGEHSGTFRGNQLGMIGGKAALEYAEITQIGEQIIKKEKFLGKQLEKMAYIDERINVRGKGLIYGIDLNAINLNASKISQKCFERHLIIENVEKNVLKVLPPLTIEEKLIEHGVEIICECVKQELAHRL